MRCPFLSGPLPILALAATLPACAPHTARLAAAPGPAACREAEAPPPRPSIDAVAPGLVTRTVVARIPVRADRFGAWFDAAPLERLLPGTRDLPGVAATHPLGDRPFPAPGSRRLVCLSDGSTALEEVLAHETGRLLDYVVWGYTTPAAAPIAYGLGSFRFTDIGDATLVTWTYAFRLKTDRFPGSLGAVGRRLFRLAFVDTAYARFMAAGMDAIKSEALAAQGR